MKPEKPVLVKRVFLFNGRSAEKPNVPKTRLQDLAAFYRAGPVGLFVSLDFPYSKIVEHGGATSISYPPHIKLAAGQEYACHTYTVGVTSPSGQQRFGYYEGEVNSVDSYVQKRFPPRFERPMNVSASIVNRYTQLENNWVFYSMKDHPTLTFHRDILKRELSLMPKLGIEFYCVYPGVFDWGPDDPSDRQVKEAMDWARQNGVRMGDYSGCNTVFCPHYNQYSNSLAGTGIEPCFGNAKFVDWYAGKVASTARKFGFEEHCLDFLAIDVCNNPNHGHPTGEDSIYHQIKGTLRLDGADRFRVPADAYLAELGLLGGPAAEGRVVCPVAVPDGPLHLHAVAGPQHDQAVGRFPPRADGHAALHALHSLSLLHQLPVFFLPELRGP